MARLAADAVGCTARERFGDGETRRACCIVDHEAPLQLAHRGVAQVVAVLAAARSQALVEVEDHALAQRAPRAGMQRFDAEAAASV